jgi:hypothetical protein
LIWILGLLSSLEDDEEPLLLLLLMRMAVARLAVGVRRVWGGSVALFSFQTTEFPKRQEFRSDTAISSVFLASEDLSTEVYDELTAHRVYRNGCLVVVGCNDLVHQATVATVAPRHLQARIATQESRTTAHLHIKFIFGPRKYKKLPPRPPRTKPSASKK